jgi:hypothetical protein
MTAVSLLSSDTVFLQPYKEEEKKKAGQAHRRFASREGDLLTLINIYEAWTKVRLIHFMMCAHLLDIFLAVFEAL